jgi:hypothetical protein
VLFDDAKGLMAQRRFAEACPMLQESQRLQPAGGTLMFLALCFEGEGRTATAWTRFNEAMSAARRDGRPDRARVAREHITALEPNLVRVRIVVDGPAADVPGLAVARDGEGISRGLWGTAVPVDPGKHVVTATAPGRRAWEQSLDLSEPGQTLALSVPVLEGAPPVAAPTAPPPAPPPSTAALVAPSPVSRPGSRQRTVALWVGAVGLAGVAVGTGFGLEAIAKKGESDGHCPGGATGGCFADGVAASKTAVTFGNLSTVAFAAGGVALAAAGVLWLAAPVTPVVDGRTAGLAFSGRF